MHDRLQRWGQPVVSADTEKEEVIGNFKDVGRGDQPVGRTEGFRVQDVQGEEPGRAIPGGVFDLTANRG